MYLLATRTVRRAFLGDGWGLKRALEAHQGVRSCLKAAHAARRAGLRVKRVA
jgi:hypothetical protein